MQKRRVDQMAEEAEEAIGERGSVELERVRGEGSGRQSQQQLQQQQQAPQWVALSPRV